MPYTSFDGVLLLAPLRLGRPTLLDSWIRGMIQDFDHTVIGHASLIKELRRHRMNAVVAAAARERHGGWRVNWGLLPSVLGRRLFPKCRQGDAELVALSPGTDKQPAPRRRGRVGIEDVPPKSQGHL
jgi:hypothetical protein